MSRFAAPGHVTVELTWWEDDGAERKGWANVAPDASPDTLYNLTQILRAAHAQMSAEGNPGAGGEAPCPRKAE